MVILEAVIQLSLLVVNSGYVQIYNLVERKRLVCLIRVFAFCLCVCVSVRVRVCVCFVLWFLFV